MNSASLIRLCFCLSTLSMLAFLYLFVERNAPGLTSLAPISTIALVYGLIYLACIWKTLKPATPASANNRPNQFLVGLICLLLIYCFLDATVFDYYQPLSLYDEAIAALAAWWVLLILGSLFALLTKHTFGSLLAPLALALLCWPLAASLAWVNQPDHGAGVTSNTAVFVGGEDGYEIYRIPGLVVIPAGAKLYNKQTLTRDRLIAFAEARRDGALDTGVIDLVLKSSDDHGATWSQQSIVCQHIKEQLRGKCGNPTPLYDADSGTVLLAYNKSGLQENDRHHTGYVVESKDGGKNWGEPKQVTADDFVFGPGKGLQKILAPFKGRLILPGYADDQAAVLYSDDAGSTWQRSGGVNESNESDVAELADGSVYLATRHRAPIAHAPEPNGRLFSTSVDGGVSWSATALQTDLPTPVCQASVLRADDGILLFSNPAHYRSRVRMTLNHSNDDGADWHSGLVIYPGPSGYSVLGQGSDGSIYVLYENGDMSYSERISLAQIARSNLAGDNRE